MTAPRASATGSMNDGVSVTLEACPVWPTGHAVATMSPNEIAAPMARSANPRRERVTAIHAAPSPTAPATTAAAAVTGIATPRQALR